MLRAAFALLALVLLAPASAPGSEAGWRAALPGWRYEWPRDHGPHRDFQTEWWYFTGHLRDEAGRRYGFQLTWFRYGIRPPAARGGEASRLIVDDLPFAHFALSELDAGRFHHAQKLSRGVLGEAGFGEPERLAWIGDWTLALTPDGNGFRLRAADGPRALELTIENTRPTWTVHGRYGISQKAAGEGRASHYYSGTRLRARGTLTLDGRRLAVAGESWFDHEWATNQLAPDQAGWDWLSLQLADGSELMLYQMRKHNGGTDSHSSGTAVAPDGFATHLTRDDYTLTPLRHWQSPATGARYPIGWRVEVPRLALSLEVQTPLPAQELPVQPTAYWEGAVNAAGTRAGVPVSGRGFLELTGYAGAIRGLSQ